jgi:hypothetical protein
VRAFAGFIVRLVGYALVLGIVSRIAEAMWVQQGLDNVPALQTFHDVGIRVLVLAPFVCALIGFRPFRRVAVFIAAVLIGIALTAPYACARFSGV